MSLAKIKNDRLKKIKNFERAGFEIYPMRAERSFLIQQAKEKFEDLNQTREEIFLVGRLKSIRSHGGSCFADLEDGTAQIQIYLKRDTLAEKYELFIENFDVGDFIQVNGYFLLTRAGEKTLEVRDYKILAKSILSLPEKWHGLKDVEERYRKRYLDLIMNKEVKEKFRMRSQLIKDLRTFLEREGFMEVETPVLQLIPGGATAKPFKTRLNALNLNLYLRVSPELYLKRLLVGGFEKVYEIGRCFRNEGIDAVHNPDFTMLEFYWAYTDYESLMELTEHLFSFLVPGLEIDYEGQKINLIPPFKRIALDNLIQEHCGFDINNISDQELILKAKNYKLEVKKNLPRFKIIDEIYTKICRPKLIQPTFVINHPVEMSPLAKSLKDNPAKAARPTGEARPERAARFQLIIGGLELVNAYSELNDPIEQEERFKEQEKHWRKGEKEAHRHDKDFIEALEHGMPPAAGFGLGVDRLIVLLTDSHSLREVILFPTMRPKK